MNHQEYATQIQRQQSSNNNASLQSDCYYDSEQWHYVNSPMKQIEGKSEVCFSLVLCNCIRKNNWKIIIFNRRG